jgi:hypothetical protein
MADQADVIGGLAVKEVNNICLAGRLAIPLLNGGYT